jgi:hypothetical protein
MNNNLLRSVISASLKTAKAVDLQKFLAGLSGKGAQFIGVTTSTDAKMLASNPFGKVTKVSTVTLQVNYDYANAVAKATGVTPESSGKTWYETVTDSKGRLTPFARHKTNGTLYLRGRHISTGEVRYFDEQGQPLEQGLVKPYLSNTPTAKAEVRAVTYKLDSILAVRYNNENLVPQ